MPAFCHQGPPAGGRGVRLEIYPNSDAVDTADPNDGDHRLLPGAPTVRSERYVIRQPGSPAGQRRGPGSPSPSGVDVDQSFRWRR